MRIPGPVIEKFSDGDRKHRHDPVTIRWDYGTNTTRSVTLTGAPTGGTFTLTFNGQTTTALAFNAGVSDVAAALRALSTIGGTNVSVYADVAAGGPYSVVFQGSLATTSLALTAAASLTGGTTPGVTVATTQTGVAGTDDVGTKLGSALLITGMSGTDTVSDFQKTIYTYETQQAVGGVNRLRFSSPTGGVGGNTRIWYPILNSSCKDSEIRSLWYSRTQVGSSGNGQFGHVHRIQPTGATGGFPWGYVVWHDALFHADWVMNANSWTGVAATGGSFTQGTRGTSGYLTGLEIKVPVLACSRVGTTVTVTMAAQHGFQVGDEVTLEGGTELDETVRIITAVGTTTATFTSATSGTTAFGGGGQLRTTNRNMPYWLCSRLEGTTLRAKAWPMSAGEPDWEDTAYAFKSGVLVDGPPATSYGNCGIFAGHLATPGTQYNELGSVTWRSLD